MRQKPILMRNQRLTLGIALLILIGLGVVFFPRSGTPDNDASSPTPRDRRNASTTKPSFDSSRDRADATSRSRLREPLPTHQTSDLPNFVLPLVEGREVSFKQAVSLLMSAYKDACYRSRTEPLALEFSLPVDSDARISFSIERGNFQVALAHLAALAGFTVKFDELNVTFEPVPESAEIFTRTFQVSSGIQQELANQLQRLGLAPGAPLADMMAAAGLTEANRSVALNTSGLLTNLTLPEMHKVETWLETLPSKSQIKASVKLIHADKALEIDPRSATPDEIREWLGSLVGQPEITATQLPNIVMREAVQATLNVTNGSPTDWTGSRVILEAVRSGLVLLAKDTTDYRPDDRSSPPVRNSSQVVARDGEPKITLVSDRDGEFLYRVLTLDIIGADGRPVREMAGGYAVAVGVPGQPGFVFSPFNNQLIDVRDLPSGTLVRDPTFPAEEKKFFRVP